MQLWNLNIRPECERKCKLRDFVLHDRRCEHASLLFSFRSSIRPNPCVLRSENAKLLLTSAWQLRWLTHIINGCRQMNMTPADLFIPFINRARADHWHLISTDFTLALTQLRWFVFLEIFSNSSGDQMAKAAEQMTKWWSCNFIVPKFTASDYLIVWPRHTDGYIFNFHNSKNFQLQIETSHNQYFWSHLQLGWRTMHSLSVDLSLQL